MRKISILLLLLNLIVVTKTKSQDIGQFFDSLKHYTTDKYIISYDFIYSSGKLGQFDYRYGRGFIQPMPDDTLGSYHNILSFNNNAIFQQIYGGKNVVNLDYIKSEGLIINLDTFKFGYNFVTGNIMSSLKPEFLFDTSFFTYYISEYEEFNIDEIYLFGKKLNKLSFKMPDSEEIKNDHFHIFIDNENKIAIGYKNIFDFNGIEFEQSLILNNLFIDSSGVHDIFNFESYTKFGIELLYLSQQQNHTQQSSESAKKILPDTFHASDFDLQDYAGKPLIMDFWYVACGPCIKLKPTIIRLHQEYPMVNFLGINRGDRQELIERYVEKNRIKYPVLRDDFGLVQKYEIYAFPVILIFNKEGTLIQRLDGFSESHYSTIKDILDQELKK